MPSLTPKSSLHGDDYDSYQPCFFKSEFEDDFYQDIPIPSDDIWKKFELLPTPPRSPQRDEDPLDDLTMENLMQVSDILDCVDIHGYDGCVSSKSGHLLSPAAKNLDGCEKCSQKMKSNLIQDCMWSTTWTCKINPGTETSKKAKSADSDSTKGKSSDSTLNSGDSKLCSTSLHSSFTGTDIPNVSTDCVDPTAVFPFATPDDKCSRLGVETPSDSEEEIDVVTVGEKKQQQVASRVAASPQLHHHLQRTSPRSIISRKSLTVLKSTNTAASTPVSSTAHTATVEAMHNYTQPKDAEPTKLSLVITRSTDNLHSYGIKRTLSDYSGLHHIPNKKLKRVFSSRSHHAYHSPPSSRSSSDSEDSMGKRSQHNDMERKRRIDLKYSFMKLRDQVPELHKVDRAPKVTILKKASEYIHQLHDNENTLTSELQQLKERKEELQQKLARLRKVTWF